jgi:hypothetical protein
MKTFDDLTFTGVGKVTAKMKLDNGINISVIGGYGCYGNGIDSFEIAAWRDNDPNFIRLGEYDDVLGYLTKDKVTAKINELSKL